MNFFDGRLLFEDNKFYFYEGANKLLLPDSWKERLSAYKSKEMVLGIRPENMVMKNQSNSQENALKVHVDVMEPLGDKMDIYMQTPKHPHIVARVDAQCCAIKEGCDMTMYIDMKRVHVFEPGENGRNVTLESRSGD
jgi:ABC-type sugar transport system ATPase subunit